MTVTWSVSSWFWPLLLVVAAGALVWTVWNYGRTQPPPGERWRAGLVLLRSVALVLLVLAVAGPVVVRLSVRQTPSELVLLLEDSGSMGIRDCPADPAGGDSTLVTRWDLASRVARTLARDFADVQPDVRVVVWRGNGLAPLRQEDFGSLAAAEPRNHGTDLAGLLAQAKARLVGRPAKALVLISDGQETRTDPLGQVVAQRGEQPQPSGLSALPGRLHVVGVGDPQGPPDRALKELRYPDLAFQGDEVVAEVGVVHRYTAVADIPPITARLHAAGGAVVAETTVAGAADLVRLEMAWRPAEVGQQVYELELSPLDNERFLGNNRASLVLNVRQERARVLLLAGHGGWDTRFLAQAARQEARLDLTVVYRSARGLVFADSLVPWVPPATAAAWEEWDGLVLTGWVGDLALDWAGLAEAVRAGLGLLVLPDAAVSAEGNDRSASPPPGLQDVLPVGEAAGGWVWSEGDYFLAVPSGAARHPVLMGSLGATGATDMSGESGPVLSLTALPPLRFLARVRPRAGATVLLTARPTEVAAGAADPPVLVVHRVGQGRVSWLGGRRLWELAFWELAGQAEADPGEHAGKRLLRNLLVWTVSGEKDADLALVGRRTVFQEGETIHLGAQWRDMRGQPVSDRRLALRVWPAAGAADSAQIRTFAFIPTPGTAGLAEVELPPLPPGEYSMQLIGEGDPPATGRQETLVVTRHSVETTQVRLDERRLRQLAGRAGGAYFRAAQPERVRALIGQLHGLDWSSQRQQAQSRFDPLAGWPFFGLVVLLLSLEWFLRRRLGLL